MPIRDRGYINMYISDISTLKNAEAALEENRAYLQEMWNSMNIGILLVDAETRCILRVNPALLRMAGCQENELIGHRCHKLVCPAEELACPVDDLGLVEERSVRILIRVDGSEMEVEKTVVPIQLDGRKVYLETLVDISERLEYERKLIALSEIQNSILKNSTLGIAMVKKRRFVWVNPRLCELLGVKEEELIGATTRLLYSSEKEYEETEMAAYAQLARGERFDARIRMPRKDGSQVWCRLTGEALNPSSPIESGSIWMFEDVSDRIAAEFERLRLSTAIEQSPETIVITDVDGQIVYANPMFEKESGYSVDEVLGQNPRILKSGEHPREFYENLWSTILSGRIWQGRFVNKRKDGTRYTEEASIAPVKNPEGQIVNYVAVKRDITEELLKEEELRQAHKLEAVGQLAGGVAHDFNNILQAITGYCTLLLINLEVGTEERSFVNEIQVAAGRAAKLTGQLLSFSRKKPVRSIRIGLNNVVRDAEALLSILLGSRYLIELNLQCDLPEILSDQDQLVQVIMNLGVNARDAMPDGGTLIISTTVACFSDEEARSMAGARAGDFVCLSVADNGTGIDESVRVHIFEPFFTTKDLGKGTGLGLSVIYGIVEQSQGWIHVESKPGEGTCFEVYLPVAGVGGGEEEGTMKHLDIEWSEELTIGSPEIDRQHRALIEAVGAVSDYAHRRDVNLLGQVLDYVLQHFADEEAYMQRIAYPGLLHQRKEHKKLIRILRAYEAEFNEGKHDLYAFKQFMFGGFVSIL